MAEGVQSLIYLLWPFKVLSVRALQLHMKGGKIPVTAFGQRKKLQGNRASHLYREVARRSAWAAEGRQRKDSSVFEGVKGVSEAEGPFSHVRMTHSGGDAVTHLLRVRSQSLELV